VVAQLELPTCEQLAQVTKVLGLTSMNTLVGTSEQLRLLFMRLATTLACCMTSMADLVVEGTHPGVNSVQELEDTWTTPADLSGGRLVQWKT